MKNQTKKQNVGAGPVSAQKKEGGITLIALVITIIVMLILVAVTISIATNGDLFKYAKRAEDETNTAIASENQILSGMLNGTSINDIVNGESESYGLVDENTFIGRPTDAPYIENPRSEMQPDNYRTQNGNATYENGYKFTTGHFVLAEGFVYYLWDDTAGSMVEQPAEDVYLCWDNGTYSNYSDFWSNYSAGWFDIYSTSGEFLGFYDFDM